MAKPDKINFSVPVATLCFLGLCLLAYGFPRLSEILVYDRRAILDGQLWRICTAPLVHFSASHLLWDLAVFGAAGWMIEASGYRGFWRVCGLGAMVPGLVFLFAVPDLARYGGLSGPATGAVVYGCLFRIMADRKSRAVWGAMIVLTAAKILAEWGMDGALFVDTRNAAFKVLPSAHAIGFAGAVLVFFTCGRFEKNGIQWPSFFTNPVKKPCHGTGGQG